MATLPNEQVTQRTHHYGVSISYDGADDSPAEQLWAGTTLGNDVTTDKTVAANQEDQDDTIARLEAAAAS